MKNALLALLGAVMGGLLGYAGFFWLADHRHYAMILPGGLLGIGAGVFKSSSKAVAVGCGMLALALGFFTEWRFAPFAADASLGYFLTHIHRLQPITLFMIAAGALIGFWVPFRRGKDLQQA